MTVGHANPASDPEGRGAEDDEDDEVLRDEAQCRKGYAKATNTGSVLGLEMEAASIGDAAA